ncbi:hypothetical protein DFO45_3249 [Azorhizobium sp. AG788]|uniref:hypothetical protein n=1 Tax=Azorhizobium sp. AG788 TaxID=2183897 RepID=UPI001061C555|nr:hypothetical protein [Azorhizobium sp. AG788]TDT92495.1 hypothetical protein DFO45_3249 [Azorhizobium sp. AG788]
MTVEYALRRAPDERLQSLVEHLLQAAWSSSLPRMKAISRRKPRLVIYKLTRELTLSNSDYSKWKGGTNYKKAAAFTDRLMLLFSGDDRFAQHGKDFDYSEAKALGADLFKFWRQNYDQERLSTITGLRQYLDLITDDEKQSARRELEERLNVNVSDGLAANAIPITTTTGRARRPQVRFVPTKQDERLVALSVEVASNNQFVSEPRAISPIMLAAVELNAVSIEEAGAMYFTAVTVRVDSGIFAHAVETDVEVLFIDHTQEFRKRDVYGKIDWSDDEIIVGERAGLRNNPSWKINRVPQRMRKSGTYISNINLGAMLVRYLSDAPPPILSLSFEAIVDLQDAVVDLGPESDIAPDAAAKRRAFDLVLLNKKLSGNGQQALVSTSIIAIEPFDGEDA